jgi:hypothetical protein
MSETAYHPEHSERMAMVSASLPADLHARLQRAARDERRSVSSFIRIAIEDRLADDGEARP